MLISLYLIYFVCNVIIQLWSRDVLFFNPKNTCIYKIHKIQARSTHHQNTTDVDHDVRKKLPELQAVDLHTHTHMHTHNSFSFGWFLIIEAQFHLRKITTITTKYRVTMSVSADAIEKVSSSILD